MQNISDTFKAKNLFLLVGTNPLPVYVAIRLLKPEQGHVYLICTALTHTIAENICGLAGLKIGHDATLISVEEADGSEIERTVYQAAKNKDDIGFNYTGGTKYMVLHAHEALKKAAGSAPLTYSYLDAQTLSIQLEKRGDSVSPSVGLALQVSIDDLLSMHSLAYSDFSTKPIYPDIYPDLIKVPYRDLTKWNNENLRGHGGDRAASVALPVGGSFENVQCHWQGATNFGELSQKWGQPIGTLTKWLSGGWLEDYTLWSLQQIAPEESHIHEFSMNLEPNNSKFEFDVVAMRGYQLFAFSCTQKSKKEDVKLKLMECYIRARQMGGDEARVAVVCRSPQYNPTNNTKLIEQEVASSDKQKQVRVFGEEHLPDLSRHLLKWFNEQ